MGYTMRFPSKIIHAASVGALGALAVFAVNTVGAQQPGPNNWHIEKINKADDAYFKAAIAIETAGESPARLEELKEADDRYFEAVMAFEAAEHEAVQIATVEAADDAYFKAAMALEQSRHQASKLAELKMERQILAQAEADNNLVTASIPAAAAADSIASNLAKIKAADDAYFDAVMALETSGENPEDLKKLKDADDAYFTAVLTLEDAYSKQAEAKNAAKAGKVVKVAAAPAAAMAQPMPAKRTAPIPSSAYRAKPKVAGKTYRKVQTASTGYQQTQQPARGPLSFIYKIVTYPARTVFGSVF